MGNLIAENPRVIETMQMHIITDPLTDRRRYNLPITNDVAAIFCSADGVPPANQDLIVYPKNDLLHHVSIYHSCLDPMSYPLLFPYGDMGYHKSLQHSRSTAVWNNLTMNEYAVYQISIRPEFSALHQSCALFLQWIVDIYV